MTNVSVIIPAHNVATCLGRCLDSVFAQSARPLETIVIDDGSIDQTSEVAKDFGDQVTIIRQENQGQGAARNAGLKIATGEFIAFLDADDYWLPEFLRTCANFLNDHPQAMAVSVAQCIKLWGKRPRITPSIVKDQKHILTPCVIENFFNFWGQHDHIRTGSCLIRRQVIQEAGYQREDLRISQDLEYWGYLATFGQWGFIPDVLWVCDPMPAASHVGWNARYKTRREMCPTVESWQRRILPRLKEDERAGFQQARGRVAAGYAHAKVLGGDTKGALDIVRRYGSEMPRTWSSRLMNLAAQRAPLGWFAGCKLLKLREAIKSTMIRFNRNHRSEHYRTTSI